MFSSAEFADEIKCKNVKIKVMKEIHVLLEWVYAVKVLFQDFQVGIFYFYSFQERKIFLKMFRLSFQNLKKYEIFETI